MKTTALKMFILIFAASPVLAQTAQPMVGAPAAVVKPADKPVEKTAKKPKAKKAAAKSSEFVQLPRLPAEQPSAPAPVAQTQILQQQVQQQAVQQQIQPQVVQQQVLPQAVQQPVQPQAVQQPVQPQVVQQPVQPQFVPQPIQPPVQAILPQAPPQVAPAPLPPAPAPVYYAPPPVVEVAPPIATPAQNVDSAEMKVPADEGSSFSTSATVMIASNYIFRGLTQTSNRAATQGSYDLSHSSGFGIGGFVSNVDMQLDTETNAPATKTEADLYMLYNGSSGDHGWGAMAIWYNYVETPHFNAAEYSLYYRYSIAKIDFMHMPTYFGAKTKANYGRLSFNIPMGAKDAFVLTAGKTTFGDESIAGFKSYWDYKAGIVHTGSDFTTEFSWTDTERKSLSDVKQFDRAFTVILSRSF